MHIRNQLLIALAATLPGTALAQSAVATRTAPVIGNAPNVCVLQPAQLALGAQINFRGLNGSTLQIESLVDPATLATRGASADLSFSAVCNFPHRLRIETLNNGLWRTNALNAASPPGFTSAIPYSARLSWAQQATVLNADAQLRRLQEKELTVNSPSAGSVLLRLEVEPGASNTQSNAPVLAGSYADTIRVFLEPQQ